jgi:DNA-directed RNA polymerase subunit L
MQVEASNYYGPHHTKPEYDHAFNNALSWALGKGSGENFAAPTRIYHIKEDSLC